LPDHLKFFQGHFVFQRDTVGYFHPFSKLSRRASQPETTMYEIEN